MVWMDRVFSLAYHAAKVASSATPKTMVVVSRATPKFYVRLSVISVPTTLIRTPRRSDRRHLRM
jgi:hypothetical protein